MSKFCQKCKSTNVSFFKRIHQGKKVKQFHYGIRCKDCQFAHKIPRTKEIYELVKNTPWEYSKNARKIRSRKGTDGSDYKEL